MSNKRSISDDDLCSGCAHCSYHPGELSSCSKDWPGTSDADGYVTDCKGFDLALFVHQGRLMERKFANDLGELDLMPYKDLTGNLEERKTSRIRLDEDAKIIQEALDYNKFVISKLEAEIERRSKMEPSPPIRMEKRNYALDGQVHSIEIPIRLLNGEEVTSGEDWYELELALAKKLIEARCMGRESLRFIRKSFSYSIMEFAKSIDSESSTVAGWESGKFAIDERVASYYHALGDENDTH